MNYRNRSVERFRKKRSFHRAKTLFLVSRNKNILSTNKNKLSGWKRTPTKEDEILLWALYYVGQNPFLCKAKKDHTVKNNGIRRVSTVSVSCKRCRCRAVFAVIVCERKGSPS